MRTLIIDSNDSYIPIYRHKLASITNRVDFAKDADKIIKLVTGRKYDVIFISHILKNLDGIAIIEKLEALNYTGKLIILASGNHIEEITNIYKETAVVGIVNKGLNRSDFIKTIKNLVKPEPTIKLGLKELH